MRNNIVFLLLSLAKFAFSYTNPILLRPLLVKKYLNHSNKPLQGSFDIFPYNPTTSENVCLFATIVGCLFCCKPLAVGLVATNPILVSDYITCCGTAILGACANAKDAKAPITVQSKTILQQQPLPMDVKLFNGQIISITHL